MQRLPRHWNGLDGNGQNEWQWTFKSSLSWSFVVATTFGLYRLIGKMCPAMNPVAFKFLIAHLTVSAKVPKWFLDVLDSCWAKLSYVVRRLGKPTHKETIMQELVDIFNILIIHVIISSLPVCFFTLKPLFHYENGGMEKWQKAGSHHMSSSSCHQGPSLSSILFQSWLSHPHGKVAPLLWAAGSVVPSPFLNIRCSLASLFSYTRGRDMEWGRESSPPIAAHQASFTPWFWLKYILGNMMALSAWRPKEDGTVFFNNCPLADRGILRQRIRSCRDIVGGSDCRQVGLFTLAAFRRIPVERQNLGGSTLSFLAFLKNRS